MKAIVFCCFTIAFLVMISGTWLKPCGPKACSPAQVCQNGQCVCKPARCSIHCPFGIKRDENGCEYPCTCAEKGEYLPQKTCGSKCSPAQICVDGKCVCQKPKPCFAHCPFGFKRDVNGCEYPCTCAEGKYPLQEQCGSKCSPAQICVNGKCVCQKPKPCFTHCPFGFKRDVNGCEYSCTCAEKGEYPPQEQCGYNKYCTGAQVCEMGKCQCSKIHCSKICPFGFKVDENGCEYPCTCAEKPLC